jgi:glycosyltransferase involved in cell wall biosynthesis
LMRILIVADSNSIHTARWISQICDQTLDIHLFSSKDHGKTHENLKNTTVYHSFYCKGHVKNASVILRGFPVLHAEWVNRGIRYLKKFNPDYRIKRLKRIIQKISPDIIHSLAIQDAGYLTLEAKKNFNGCFPPWIVTNWGSDIYLFGRLAEHEPKIMEVLRTCDYYSCECQRDIKLAHEYGYNGRVFPVFPNTGGFDLESVSKLRQSGMISDRRMIMLKGYQSWAGRALVGLRALERCADLLKGYEVVIYSFVPEVLISAEIFQQSTGIKVRIIPKNTLHRDILKLHGQSRISIGLSISDAISTSCLEAMVMGSFPIQSWTSCADEWINDGKTGILVPPEDPEIVEQAIRRALADDDLVNHASEINYRMAEEKLDRDILKPMAIDMYNIVLSEKRN